jgi:hypothetical protein
MRVFHYMHWWTLLPYRTTQERPYTVVTITLPTNCLNRIERFALSMHVHSDIGNGSQRQDALILPALDVWIIEAARRAQSIVLTCMVPLSQCDSASIALPRFEPLGPGRRNLTSFELRSTISKHMSRCHCSCRSKPYLCAFAVA